MAIVADYFSDAEFRALPDMSSVVTYPDDRVTLVAAYITGIIEREVGTSFVARTVTETLDGNGSNMLVLGSAFPRSVTSVTIAGVVTSMTGLVSTSGVLRWGSTAATSCWPCGVGNVVVVYTAGYTAAPPPDVKEAALRGTRAYLLETSANAGVLDRRSSVSNELGGTTTYVIPGTKQPTGYPQVDSVILGWQKRLDVFGFA